MGIVTKGVKDYASFLRWYPKVRSAFWLFDGLHLSNPLHSAFSLSVTERLPCRAQLVMFPCSFQLLFKSCSFQGERKNHKETVWPFLQTGCLQKKKRAWDRTGRELLRICLLKLFASIIHSCC